MHTFVMRVIFLMIGVFILSQESKAQSNGEYLIEYIDVGKGLSNNYVSEIIEDDLGIKWFAAEGGVNKYEGSNTVTIHRPGSKYPGLKKRKH